MVPCLQHAGTSLLLLCGVASQSSIARRTTCTTSLGRKPVPCRKPKLLTIIVCPLGDFSGFFFRLLRCTAVAKKGTGTTRPSAGTSQSPFLQPAGGPCLSLVSEKSSSLKCVLFRNFVFIFICFKKTYPLYTLHELARLMQKSVIFLGVENGKSLLGKE